MILEVPLEALILILAGPPPSLFDDVLCELNTAHAQNAAQVVMIRNRLNYPE
jgi:hypothetical protein